MGTNFLEDDEEEDEEILALSLSRKPMFDLVFVKKSCELGEM